MHSDEISFFTRELLILIIIIVLIPSIFLIIAYVMGFKDLGMGLFGAILGSLMTLIGSYYTNYNNNKEFLEEKKLSEDLLHHELNLEMQRDMTIALNKKITKVIVNSDIFKKTMSLHEFSTLDEVILFFLKFEKHIYYELYYEFGENYFEYMIQEFGEDLFKLFKKEMMSLDEIIYLPQVIREEILYWTNNYSIVKSVKRDLKDNAPYFRFGETHYYPNNMNYKALYYDLKILCAVIWRDTNSFLFNNINLTSREDIKVLFNSDLNNDYEIYKYVVFNEYEDEEFNKVIGVNLGENFVKKNIFKELFGDLYSQFENRLNY